MLIIVKFVKEKEERIFSNIIWILMKTIIADMVLSLIHI